MIEETQLKFDLPSDLKDRIDETFRDHGTTMKTGLNRLIEWFLQQPATVRSGIVDRNGDPNLEIARQKLAEMKTVGEGVNLTAKMDPIEAVRVIRAMADRIEIDVRGRAKKPAK